MYGRSSTPDYPDSQRRVAALKNIAVTCYLLGAFVALLRRTFHLPCRHRHVDSCTRISLRGIIDPNSLVEGWDTSNPGMSDNVVQVAKDWLRLQGDCVSQPE